MRKIKRVIEREFVAKKKNLENDVNINVDKPFCELCNRLGFKSTASYEMVEKWPA